MQAGSVAAFMAGNQRPVSCSPCCIITTSTIFATGGGLILGLALVPAYGASSRIHSACCELITNPPTEHCLSLISNMNVTNLTSYCADLANQMPGQVFGLSLSSVLTGAAALTAVSAAGLWLYRHLKTDGYEPFL